MLNSRMGNIETNENMLQPLKAELQSLKTDIQSLNEVLVTTNERIKKLEELQAQDQELRTKFATFVSYGDKKRMNAVIKDVNLIKKQINLSRTSKILDTLHKLEQRMDDMENSLVSDFEEGT